MKGNSEEIPERGVIAFVLAITLSHVVLLAQDTVNRPNPLAIPEKVQAGG